MATHPEVLWAQRSSDSDAQRNVIYLTVNLPQIQESSLTYDLKPGSLSFSATSGDGIHEGKYAFDMPFYKEVDPEHSNRKLTTRSLKFVLRKKDKGLEYWPRLTAQKNSNSHIKTDYDKWVDEDEQGGESNDFGFDNFGAAGLGGAGEVDFEAMMKAGD
ncbi:hypothetical protein RU639_004969 [Aspergillus parasiticus]